MEILRTVIEGLGAVALMFVGLVLSDLRERVVRIENYIFLGRKNVIS
jgi:hypothetical protein